MLAILREVLRATLYRVGTIARIRVGPARGLRYRIFAEPAMIIEQVTRLDLGWPARDGVWGQVLATPDNTSASDRENQE